MYTQNELSSIIQKAINEIQYPTVAKELFEPIIYTLAAGGKRIRPTLVLMSANLFTDDITPAIQAAVGLEMDHNFTLLHDDVMDNAPDRRGRATVHVKWNSNVAILTGDVMQSLAYQFIASVPSQALKPVLDLFSQTNIEICQGQQLDFEFETRTDVKIEEYIEMIRLKTAVLLGCATKMGAIIGGASTQDANTLYDFAINMGLAFQLQDDWLDCYGDPKTFGKKIGGDIANNKKTYLLIKAIELANAEQKAIIEREINPATASMNEAEKIAYFCNSYKECGAEAACRNLIQSYSTRAIECLQKLSVDKERYSELLAIANKLTNRNI